MSGHSKWSQIKRQKGVADIKKGQVFTKLANVITIAVREGGGVSDPNQNFKLRLVIEKAREVNMPKENIERAIKRAEGKLAGEGLEEITYEGFGPGGSAVIAQATTDNKLRTAQEVKNVFDKSGGILGNPGAVSYQFQIKGLINVKKNGKTIDDIFLIAADAGAEDVEDAGDNVTIYTKPDQLAKVKDVLIENNLVVVDFELTKKPIVTVEVKDKETAQKIITFIEKLEALDDIQKVYSNFDIPDDILRQLDV